MSEKVDYATNTVDRNENPDHEAATLSPEEEKRIIRKIDWNLMPLLTISYAFQYLDKTSLSYSAVLGIKGDLNLVGQDYSWTSSIFYIGYLAASYPISLGFVKFPLGRYLSLLIILWGIVLTLHAVAQNYAGLMVLRTFLGIFESAISPGFSLITGMWYTPREHISRHSVWFAGNAAAGIIGSLIAYGVLFYKGSLAQWKLLFLVFGLVTVAWGVVLWFFLPDSPANARFLTPAEREFASLRPKKFQRTTQTRKWDKGQFIETAKDIKTWWFLVFSFIICVPNGGITSFQSLIIKSFGYDVYKTILMQLPGSAFQFTMVVLVGVFTTLFRKSRLIAMVALFLVSIAGILMIKLLPEHLKLSRLAGFWLVQCISPAFPLMMSLFASNIAGFTKKSTVAPLIFVGYCVGNLVGPQFFISKEAPNYYTAYTTILICFAITIFMAVIFRVYLDWENRRRNRAQGVKIDAEETRAVDLESDEALADVDETDVQNKNFRYIL
ncbi:Major Facilitator Superfamily [Aspergillus sclerotialis]|uniref:Major Facilitator Superfamily n=1 Tax=Aspergillus sclerotialis TaxID=2070753 RepID=A0A3A2ZZ27_9EURO|nr:Major Facilitator Superfamily [Aspergillus sclerotialis]